MNFEHDFVTSLIAWSNNMHQKAEELICKKHVQIDFVAAIFYHGRGYTGNLNSG
jgi:hypothetical protein